MFRWLWWIWGLNTTVWHAIMFALVLQVLKPAAANGLLHLFVVSSDCNNLLGVALVEQTHVDTSIHPSACWA